MLASLGAAAPSVAASDKKVVIIVGATHSVTAR
jgi:hypothetical protein